MPKSHVKSLMEAKGLTVRALAARTNLTEQTIMKARNDDKILTCRMNTLAKIASALGVELDDLFEAGGKEAGISEMLKIEVYSDVIAIPEYLKSFLPKVNKLFASGNYEEGIEMLHKELKAIVELLNVALVNSKK